MEGFPGSAGLGVAPCLALPAQCDTAEVCAGLRTRWKSQQCFLLGKEQSCHLVTSGFVGHPGRCCSPRGHRGTVALPQPVLSLQGGPCARQGMGFQCLQKGLGCRVWCKVRIAPARRAKQCLRQVVLVSWGWWHSAGSWPQGCGGQAGAGPVCTSCAGRGSHSFPCPSETLDFIYKWLHRG